MRNGEKKPQVLQLGAESTFEGGGDKPELYANFVAAQQNFLFLINSDRVGASEQRSKFLSHAVCGDK
jgi:hypothetical protein